MYDNSRVPSFTNVSSHPCRGQFNHWPLDTSTTGTPRGQSLSQPKGTFPSSFYLPRSHQSKQVVVPNYVNYYPSSSPLSSSSSSLSTSHLCNDQRPKSTIVQISSSRNHSQQHMIDSSQRYNSKTLVGIVKPMIHQSSCTQLNDNNNENKTSQLMIASYDRNLTRALYRLPSATLPHPQLDTSSVMYRSRPTSSYNGINSHPPIVPRRHSSISTSKSTPFRRSSRTISTASSSCENDHSQNQHQPSQNSESIHIDVKRLELFYGSVGTLVKAASSIARLYTTTTKQLVTFEDWPCQQRGVPVWVYNTGANLKRTRQVKLLLAQQESCFPMWSSSVSDRAELRLPKDNYITCWLPDCNLLAVLQFDSSNACRTFYQYYYELLDYEERITSVNLSLSAAEDKVTHHQQTNVGNNNKEIPRRYSRLRTTSNKPDKEQQLLELRRSRSLSKIRTVKKSSISGPINFEHINHIGNGRNQERPLSGTITLRSLHASMSHLPTNSTAADRYPKQRKPHAATLFEPRTTAV